MKSSNYVGHGRIMKGVGRGEWPHESKNVQYKREEGMGNAFGKGKAERGLGTRGIGKR